MHTVAGLKVPENNVVTERLNNHPGWGNSVTSVDYLGCVKAFVANP